jgi:hypothetical protein
VEQQRKREANLVRLMDSSRERGVPAAIEEWERWMAEKRAKAQDDSSGVPTRTP